MANSEHVERLISGVHVWNDWYQADDVYYTTTPDLRGADLRGADLRGAVLRGADLSDANLFGADLFGADLSDANLSDAKLPKAPVIEQLDAKILAAIEAPGCSLEMQRWHTCETTHCRAGWAIVVAGKEGQELEKKYGPSVAGSLIYHASTGRVPDFHHMDNDAALEDIREQAALQMGGDA